MRWSIGYMSADPAAARYEIVHSATIPKRVLVLGAGLTGVTSAWYLDRAGFDVQVLERRAGVALETSFANGGQISVSHPEPWSNPSAPATVLKWLGRDDAPLLLRPRLDPALWRWALAFARECLPARSARNTRAIAALAIHSRQCLRELRRQLGLDYGQRCDGILHLFRDGGEMKAGTSRVEELARLGIATELLDRGACERIEPALADDPDALVGGLYARDDESGDAHLFVRALATRCREAGVRFEFDTRVEALCLAQGRVTGVRVRRADGTDAVIAADAVVLCLGSYSAAMLPAGRRLDIYPVKGYSVSIALKDPARAPGVSLTEERRRIVCSRLGDRIRVAGTAELNGFDLSPNPARSGALLAWFEEHFPGAGETDGVEHWCGLRPATPSNVPHIGASGIAGLWLNTGHGTLGWTLSCGSADSLARLMCGQRPAPDFPFRA